MIWNLAIRRPVLTIVAFLVIAIFGGYGYTQLPIRENPDIEFPIVSVNIVLPGAEPEVIETEIIEPLESEINTIEGLKELRSTAREQVATITAEFELWRDIDIAQQDVRDRIDRARRELPTGIEAPIVRKLDPDARAIMWITLTGDERWDLVRMTDYAKNQLKERLESIRGVGQVQVGGERTYAVRIQLDAEKLAAHRLTVQDVVRTIEANNVDIPSGRVESEKREFLVKTAGQFSSPEPFNDLIVTSPNGSVVRIADLGKAMAGVENDRKIARFAGEPAIGLGIVKQSDANAVALAKTVRTKIEALSEEFPPGLEYTIATDDTEYIESSIRDLLTTILLATALVVVVVMLFLRTFRGTIITSLAIPTSLLGGMALIYAAGFSLNQLTLLALILVIGIVVDDAIVILESSYRHMEEGAERIPATRTGTTEVAFAAIANSLSLAAVFIPVAFTAGIIGRFFFQFGVTVTVTVFASTFTALTLTPMLCSRLLRVPAERGRLFKWSERMFGKFEAAYAATLRAAFRHRAVTMGFAVLSLVLGGVFFSALSREFLPDVDRSSFMISFETPEGATLSQTDEYARSIERVLAETPEVKHQFLAIGLAEAGPGSVNEGISFVHLTPRGDRDKHQSTVMQDIREKLATIPLGRAFVMSAGGPVAQQAPLEIVLQGSDLDELARRQERIMDWMKKQPSYVGVRSNLKMNKPQVRVGLHRDKALELGISAAQVSNTLRYLLGEPTISEIERQNERYDVITESAGKGSMVPDDLASLYVRSPAGALVSLGDVTRLEETIGPSEIHHFNRLRSSTISASTPPGVALGDALTKAETYVTNELPPGFDYTLAGQAQTFQESFRYLAIAILFSAVFVFLILAAQFESFLHPFTILMAVPLAAIGAFGALWLFGMTFNIFSFIGIIMLLGMATKNAILLVDYTNVLVERGSNPIEAAMEAGRVRFRPVIMTTFSTVLGMLPIAVGFGAGGEARRPLGVAVASGLLATTFLTLIVVPVLYSLFAQLQRKTKNLRHRHQGSEASA
ncbi:MAG: efflux RND transporter permease subunit [Myxococcota bacterium]